MGDISNNDNIIDSRDVIARIEELEAELEAEQEQFQAQIEELEAELEDAEDAEREGILERIEDLKVELQDIDTSELTALQAFAEEASQCSGDWTHGEVLIRRDHFVEYAQQLADDIGAIDSKAGWPLTHIDWDAAADDLLNDYSEVDFDGESYYIRCS